MLWYLTLLVILMATLTFTWVQVLATLPSSVNKHHWPDLAAGQWQDVVRLLGVHTAAPQGELLLRARQQPQQHLERKRTSTSAPYVVFAVTSGQQSTHCGHWSQAEWEGWLSIFSTKVCVSLMASGWTYRGPLGQTVEVSVQRRREHVQVEWVDVALQPITDLVESGGHTDTMFAASTNLFFFLLLKGFTFKEKYNNRKKNMIEKLWNSTTSPGYSSKATDLHRPNLIFKRDCWIFQLWFTDNITL